MPLTCLSAYLCPDGWYPISGYMSLRDLQVLNSLVIVASKGNMTYALRTAQTWLSLYKFLPTSIFQLIINLPHWETKPLHSCLELSSIKAALQWISHNPQGFYQGFRGHFVIHLMANKGHHVSAADRTHGAHVETVLRADTRIQASLIICQIWPAN